MRPLYRTATLEDPARGLPLPVRPTKQLLERLGTRYFGNSQ